MSLLEDLLSSLKEDQPVQEVHTCVFWTAVIAGRCGLASTIPPAGPHASQLVRGVGKLAGGSARQLAEYAKSSNTLEASIGVAALNSLLKPMEAHLSHQDVLQLLLREAKGRRLAVVGHFPFLERLRGEAGELFVLEKNPSQGELPEEEAGRALSRAEVVAITGSALINHTLEQLLALCRPGSYVLVIGPSTPLSPVLFDYGADALAGVEVVDTPELLRHIQEGATFRQVRGVRKVTMNRRSNI